MTTEIKVPLTIEILDVLLTLAEANETEKPLLRQRVTKALFRVERYLREEQFELLQLFGYEFRITVKFDQIAANLTLAFPEEK